MTAILGSRRTTGAMTLPLLALLLGLVVVRQASADLNADFNRCRASIIQIGEHPRTADEAYCLGLSYQFAINRKRDSAKALEWLRRAANQGQAGAQAVLGYMLEQGIGAGRDPVQAFQWYQRSAQAGSDDGLVNLGRAYENGIGTARDVAKARGYYERAAAMGSEPARQALANLGARAGGGDGLRGSGASPGGGAASSAEFRRGVELYKAERFAEAAALFQALAERGHVLSQRQVGYQYEFGEGLPRNPALAARWYRRAAEQGDAPAQNNLANCYENGIGVAENWAESFRWLQRSAKQNNARGLFGVGRAYQFGIGVPQDRAEAIRWFDRAAARGDDQANYWHDTLRGRGNFIGFRNEAEQQYVVGGRLPTDTALVFAEPRGMAFTNSAQRNAYLVRLKTDTLYNEAKAKWNMAADRYAACKRGETGESYCSSPGPSP